MIITNRRQITIILLLIVNVGLIWPTTEVLVFYDVNQQQAAAYAAIADGEEFVLSFVHSVNKRPVYEYIEVHNKELVVKKTVYDSFGAGMPEGTVAGMEPHLNREGLLEITSMDYRLPEINLFIGTVANHRISIRNQEIPLADLVQPGKPMQIKVTRVSVLQLWKGRCL